MTDLADMSIEDLKAPTWNEIEALPFKATLNRIRVRVVDVEEKTAGGILLASKTLEKEQGAVSAGVVLDVGPDAYAEYEDRRIKPGSIVLFAKYAGAKLPGRDKERIINDTDVHGVSA